MCFCELLCTQNSTVPLLAKSQQLHDFAQFAYMAFLVNADVVTLSHHKRHVIRAHAGWLTLQLACCFHMHANSLTKQCCQVCTFMANLAQNADQRSFWQLLLHPLVFNISPPAGCLGGPRRLLKADGARQTGPNWLQNMATHICLHHPTGDWLRLCQVLSDSGVACLGQYLGPA